MLPVNGTREALFAFAQTVVDRSAKAPAVFMPNPFYQIYEGAAILAGAEPIYVPCWESHGFSPDFDTLTESDWQRCQLLYLCTPGNPAGNVMNQSQLQALIHKADEYDFVIASDECYSELYPDEQNPPTGILEACRAMGRHDYRRCVAFHSLSKRSNLPGLRSGFVAGDATILEKFYQYRTYHGCAMPVTHQLASVLAWDDEDHVIANRALYREKFAAVIAELNPTLEVKQPEAGFYLWPQAPMPDDQFAQHLYTQTNVVVLPGRYLSRDGGQGNPGNNRVRMALVAPLEHCVNAAQRIRRCLSGTQ